MAMSLTNKTDQIYISMRAPPCFKSCAMFQEERKVAKMAELLQKGKEESDQRNAIARQLLRKQNMEDVPITLGNVAEKVRIFATGTLLKAQAKRPPSAPDGVAPGPPPKRVSVIKAPPVEKPPHAKIPGFPEETLARMITKAKFVGEERSKDPVMKKPPGLPPPIQPTQPFVPKQPIISIPEEPPAPPPGAPTGLQRQIPEPPTWDRPEGESEAPDAGPWYTDQTRFPKYAPVPAGPLPKAIQTGTGPVYLHETGNAATADPANVPTKAAPFNYVTASETQCYYRMGPPPDVDRGSTHDAATRPPTWTSTNAIPRPPCIF